MSDKTKSKGGVWQFIKFALFSASAGIIQILSFTPVSYTHLIAGKNHSPGLMFFVIITASSSGAV